MAARILVVEDEAIVAEDLRVTLQTLGYEVCAVVDSGEAAVREAEGQKPNLVLMDIVLAGPMRGTDAGEQIRSLLDIPVVYLTAYTDDETLARARITDPAGYIVKPFDDQELKSVIEIALHKARLEAARGVARRAFEASLRRARDELEHRVEVRSLRWPDTGGPPDEADDRPHEEPESSEESELLRQLLDLQERERRVIVHEIHDGFIQTVLGALMHLQAECERVEAGKAAGVEKLRTVVDLLRTAIVEARGLIADLRPMAIEGGGIVEAVGQLVEAEKAQGNLYVAYSHDVRFRRLDSMLEGAMYRIVQEALNNVKRHAGTNHASVRIEQQGPLVRIEIRDQGAGFEPSNVPANRFGLRSMHERARLFGGQCTVESRPGEGTKVTVALPITPRPGAET